MKRGLEALTPQEINWLSIHDELQAADHGMWKTTRDPNSLFLGTKGKETDCLKAMLHILSLEDSFSLLSNELSSCAVVSLKHMNHEMDEELMYRCHYKQKRSLTEDTEEDNNIPGFVSPASQICINSIQRCWKWVENLARCINIHLANSANYQQFFVEFAENEKWMRKDLSRILKVYQNHETGSNGSNSQQLLHELQDVGVVLRQWQAKVDRIWTSACNIFPVELRTLEIKEAIPARALCGFASKQIEFDENEDLLLLRAETKSTRWSLSNCRGQTGDAPSVIILLPGTERKAIRAAVKMRLTLLEVWTDIMKTLGRLCMTVMLSIFNTEYSDDEIMALKTLSERDKRELLSILESIKEMLTCIWPEHEDFISLNKRLLLLQMILEQPSQHPRATALSDLAVAESLVVQVNALQQLLNAYQEIVVSPLKDLWKSWNIIRISPELNSHPEIQELIEKWEKEHLANRVFFTSFWRTDIPIYEMERTLVELYKFQVSGIVLQDPEIKAIKTSYAPVQSTEFSEFSERQTTTSPDSAFLENSLEEDGIDLGIGIETKIAKTEQFSSSMLEENKRFVIRSVVNPNNGEDISLRDAIDLGVICPSDGIYVSAMSGEVKPIPLAMKEGLIKVLFTTTKRTKEKKSSIGLITIKTIREQTRPYQVQTAVDTRTGKEMSREEAVDKNIIDEGHGIYTDQQRGKKMLIAEAVELGLVNVEYTGEAPDPEIISETYAVYGVLDRGRQKLITFLDALKKGIVDKEVGIYHDTLVGQRMHVGDAILQGYMKAKLVDDVSKLSVDVLTVESADTNFN